MGLDWSKIIDTSDLELPEWKIIREGVAELIQKVAEYAKVYPYFELEFDPNTLQRKVTPLLNGIEDHVNQVHCWMVGITAANPVTTGDGQSELVGAFAYRWRLTLEIEGFFDQKTDDPWSITENELQKVHTIVFRNQDKILPNCKFYDMVWGTIDLEAFADGKNLIVVQGSCQVDLMITIEV